MTEHEFVHTGLLASALGIWIWGALLRRELLSIPHAIFGFIEQHRERHARWWPSARREARLMVWATCFMAYEASAPLCPVVFAIDAQGASHLDAGGFGIVCRSVKPSLINECYCRGAALGLSVVRASGELSGPRKLSPQLSLTALHLVARQTLRRVLVGGGLGTLEACRSCHARGISCGRAPRSSPSATLAFP